MAVRSTNKNGGFDTSPTGLEPAGSVAGDRIFAVIYQNATEVFTPATGWTQIGATQTVAGGDSYACFQIIRGSSIPSYVWTSTNSGYWEVQTVSLSGRGTGALSFFTLTGPTFIGSTPYTATLGGGTAGAGDDLVVLYGFNPGSTGVWSGISGTPGTGIDQGTAVTGNAATSIGTLANVAGGATGSFTSLFDKPGGGGGEFSGGFAAYLIGVPGPSLSISIPTYNSYITM